MSERQDRAPASTTQPVLQAEIVSVRAQLKALAETNAAVLLPSSHNACLDRNAPHLTKAQRLWRRLGELIALTG
jgi:hypothetical protein